jgi:tetratricopeptide (TPR) repeat protein
MQARCTIYLVLHCLLIALLIPTNSYAQTEDVSLLISKADKLPDTDTNKLYNYCDAAITLGRNAEFEKAKEVLKKAQAVFDKSKNQRMEALYYYSSGYINYSLQDYTNSLSDMLKAIKLYEKQNNRSRLAACNTVIGLIYQDQTFYERAEPFLKKVVELRLEIKDSMRLSGAYSNLGLNYFRLAQKKKKQDVDCEEIREAFKNLNLALLIAQRLRIPNQEATALGNLSNMMTDQKKYTEALKYALKGLEIYRNLGDPYEEAVSLIDLGSVYFAQKNYKEAAAYFQASLDIATKNKYGELERYAYSNLWQVNEKTGNYKDAFKFLYKEKAIHDSVFNKENLKQINEMQIKYETEKKETENALLLVKNQLSDKAIKNQKNIILFSVIGLILALIFSFFIFRGLKKQKEANRIISQQKKEVEDKNTLIHRQHELLEEKQKEILDSINYAKRIQGAHLPTDKYINRSLGRLKK